LASNHNKQLLLFSFYYFLNAPESTIECTFKATTQFAYLVWLTGHIFDIHKAPFPAIRVTRYNEHVDTDTIYVNVSALTLDPFLISAQLFCGTETYFFNINDVQTDVDFS